MYKTKTAIEATHYVTPPILLKKLLSQNDDLETIQRALEIYLESKRQLFPRFYFISNYDLLEVKLKILKKLKQRKILIEKKTVDPRQCQKT